ncbi:hypothetical protein K3495_g11383, partial [Podosphaera aphanis]
PLPSQKRDDPQNPPIIDELEETEYEIDSILRARTIRRGRGSFRQGLVKWAGWKEHTWEPVENLQDTEALEKFETQYGSILTNDGPPETDTGAYVGPAEPHTMNKRRQRRSKRLSTRMATIGEEREL